MSSSYDLIQTSFNNYKMRLTNPFLREQVHYVCHLLHSFFLLPAYTAPSCLLVLQEGENLFFKRKGLNVYLHEHFEVSKIMFSSESPSVFNKVFCYDLDMNGQNRRCKLFEFFF